ncbi:Small auxin-up RNA [Dillenia turbinata]|uniref:Small auxin-up RNA n=1 Tax=Dillenia turbinata TaxID=194707 RepID=A0AAN8WCT1_9MAGN
MGIRCPVVLQAKQILRRSLASSLNANVPKGYLAVYVGELEKKRFLVPISYLNQPSFQDLLRKAEEEFGYDHPMGGLTIPCTEDTFLHLTSQFDRSLQTFSSPPLILVEIAKQISNLYYIYENILVVKPTQTIYDKISLLLLLFSCSVSQAKIHSLRNMGLRLPAVLQAKKILLRSLTNSPNANVPKGYLAVYVGEMEKKRFVVPISYLNQPSFQDLLRKAEEEFGYDHPMGGLTIPCTEDTFIDLASQLDRL